MGVIDIKDLTGGVSDAHPNSMADNQMMVAWDVDQWNSDICARRNGCVNYGNGSGSSGLFRHYPDSDPDNDILISFETPPARYSLAGVQTAITTTPADVLAPNAGGGVSAVSLHGKLYICIKSTPARMHVWDGTIIRRMGLAAAAVPTVANTGGGAYPATLRFYRVRYTVQIAGTTTLRSEGSSSVSFTPSGAGTAARVTKPAAITEGETHWELYASPDNANFYRIATTVVGTTTFDDSALPSTYSAGILDESAGDYTLLRSARWVTTDNDRLIIGGDFESATFDSRVQWAQLPGETGVGNDERAPSSVANYVDCDGSRGGGLTGLSGFEGKIVAFKRSQIHVLVRSGLGANAYVPSDVIRTHGALPYSIDVGKDADNRSALYFMDPETGPAVMGAQGVRSLCTDRLLRLWQSFRFVAKTAGRTAVGLYYPAKMQMWWFLPATASGFTTHKWVYHVQTGAVTFHTTPFQGVAAAIFQDRSVGHGLPSTDLPFYATTGSNIMVADAPTKTQDDTASYRAYIRTKAYPLNQMLKQGGVNGVVVETSPNTGVTLTATLIRNYGVETVSKTLLLAPAGSETAMTIPIDDLAIAEATTVQLEIGDAAAVSTLPWQLHRVTMNTTTGGRT